jgi:hypothetical protein
MRKSTTPGPWCCVGRKLRAEVKGAHEELMAMKEGMKAVRTDPCSEQPAASSQQPAASSEQRAATDPSEVAYPSAALRDPCSQTPAARRQTPDAAASHPVGPSGVNAALRESGLIGESYTESQLDVACHG